MSNLLSLTFPDGSFAATMTAYQAVLKEYYGPQIIKSMVYQKNPFYAMVNKDESWAGVIVPWPVIYGYPQGRSATFSTALANQTSTASTRFAIQVVQDYALATVTTLVSLASRDNSGAFVKALTTEMDNAIKQLRNSMSGSLFRSGTGSIGVVDSGGVSTGVITLTAPGDVTQFEVGQVLQASATDGGTPRAALGYVIAVSRGWATSTVTVSASAGGVAGTPSAWAAGDYLLVQGDSNLKAKGLAGWLPTVAPTTGDNFFGVDRSVDVNRLAGNFFNGTGESIEEALIDGSANVSLNDGSPNTVITNYQTFSALSKALGSKVQYVRREIRDVGVSFDGIRIHGPDEELAVFADRSCQSQRAYVLDPESWTLGSYKAAPHIYDEDGMQVLRAPTADAVQVRVVSYHNLACNAPGHNGVVTTST